MLDTNNPSIGRFDKSFLVHMIRDFFLVLLAVSALEFALKAAFVFYNYSLNGVFQAQVVADDLAENVRSITVQGDLRGQIDSVVTGVRRLERDAMLAAKREPRLSNDWFTAIRASVQALDDRLAQAGDTPQAGELLDTLRAVVLDAETQLATSEKVFERLAAIGDDTENLKGSMSAVDRGHQHLAGGHHRGHHQRKQRGTRQITRPERDSSGGRAAQHEQVKHRKRPSERPACDIGR